MENLSQKAIQSVQQAELAYCKFITANDTGETGGHQFGFHIHKHSWKLIFDAPGEKGSNKEKHVKILWQGDFETDSRFIYYGVGTRNEYRLTRFGRGFPYLSEECVGDILVLCRKSDDFYEAFVLQTEDEIESFFIAFGISANEANGLIEKGTSVNPEDNLFQCFTTYINSIKIDFPTTYELSRNARTCYINSFSIKESFIKDNPDKQLIEWIGTEYLLFKSFENDRYRTRIKSLFKNVEELVDFANTILNRRKSRAGKSLEHHLSEMFNLFGVNYSTLGTTEENKKPDFLFPNTEAYHNDKFDSRKLVFLASKTTCKDRWRQILNEADRIKDKHLFTLQQGISKNQLAEMHKAGVTLVVPEPYLTSFPKEFREGILTLKSFVSLVLSRQK